MVDSHDEFRLTEVDTSIKDAIEQAVAYLSRKFKCTANTTEFSEMQYSLGMYALLYGLNNWPDVFTDSEVQMLI